MFKGDRSPRVLHMIRDFMLILALSHRKHVLKIVFNVMHIVMIYV